MALFLFGAVIVLFALISSRVERAPLSAPLFFVVTGLLIGPVGLGLVQIRPEWEVINTLTEVTLAIVLFTDASRINIRQLQTERSIPLRLLGIGLPLTILAGALAGLLVFPEMPLIAALVLGTILAPTDAALGQAVVNHSAVPVRIRQSLNVESGLNDGLALPVVLIAISLLAGEQHDSWYWARFTALQLILGPIVGIAVGLFGGWLLQIGKQRNWISPVFQRLGMLALAMVAFGGAELVHGNGFIAAFCAGAALGIRGRELCKPLHHFADAEGQLLSLTTFLIFGILMIPIALQHLEWQHFLYAILSLTLVRILPVAISLVGTGLHGYSMAFIGWFGPRGLASILYLLLVMGEDGIQATIPFFNIVVVTVMLSVLLHGVTAVPVARLYGRHMARHLSLEKPEHQAVPDLPTRHPYGYH